VGNPAEETYRYPNKILSPLPETIGAAAGLSNWKRPSEFGIWQEKTAAFGCGLLRVLRFSQELPCNLHEAGRARDGDGVEAVCVR
jgi:hypothetical protein